MTKLDSFHINQQVQYKQHSGFITFIDPSYITICIKEWDKSPEEKQGSKHPTRQCNLLVYPHDWQYLKLIHIG